MQQLGVEHDTGAEAIQERQGCVGSIDVSSVGHLEERKVLRAPEVLGIAACLVQAQQAQGIARDAVAYTAALTQETSLPHGLSCTPRLVEVSPLAKHLVGIAQQQHPRWGTVAPLDQFVSRMLARYGSTRSVAHFILQASWLQPALTYHESACCHSQTPSRFGTRSIPECRATYRRSRAPTAAAVACA